MTLEALEGRGATGDSPGRAAAFRAEALLVKPNDLATIIYTSGTTGEPKGVMLSHDNIYSNVAATRNALVMRGDDVSLSFLPLSHILQRMGDYWFLATGTSHDAGASHHRDLRPSSVREDVCARARECARRWGREETHLLLGARRRRSLGG
jgi:long-chain acyl-CoA synthetase